MSTKVEAQVLANLTCVIFRCEVRGSEAWTYVSEGANYLFEIAPSDFMSGKSSLVQMVHDEDRARVVKNLESAFKIAGIAGVSRYEMEYRVLDGAGRVHWVIEQGSVVTDKDGHSVRDGLIVDVSPHKEAADLVSEHQTRVATSARLYSLSEMASGIAHEINNPLAVIKARASQIKAQLTTGNLDQLFLARMAENIDSMTVRISKIVKSLRMLARDSSADVFEDSDLRVLISDALELSHQKMLDAGIRVEFTGLENAIPIICKPVQVAQVLVHLLKNSFDAVETLEVKFVRIDVNAGEDFVDIRITDSGSGIARTLADKIFQPFFTTKDVGKGTGLGLSVSKSFIKSHGGKLFVDPSVENTCFVITLPKDPLKIFRAS